MVIYTYMYVCLYVYVQVQDINFVLQFGKNFVLSGGKLSGGVNGEGIQYYKLLVNELLSRGI